MGKIVSNCLRTGGIGWVDRSTLGLGGIGQNLFRSGWEWQNFPEHWDWSDFLDK